MPLSSDQGEEEEEEVEGGGLSGVNQEGEAAGMDDFICLVEFLLTLLK